MIPSLISMRPNVGVGSKAFRYLIEEYGCVFWNSGNDIRDFVLKYPNLWFIIDIYGWHSNPLAIYNSHRDYFMEHGSIPKNLLYYNCGILHDYSNPFSSGYDSTGLDEFGTHGYIPQILRSYNYGKAQQHVLDCRKFMPMLTPLVTHPNNNVTVMQDEDESFVIAHPFIVEAGVWAFHVDILDKVADQIPDGVKLAAYITKQDFEKDEDALRAIGGRIAEYGGAFMLYNDDPSLWGVIYPSGPALSPKGRAILEGLQVPE